MNGNAELLNYIFQNAQMGTKTIEKLLDIVEEGDFKNQLESQYNEYAEIQKIAEEMLNKNNYDEKGISAFETIRAYLMIDIQTLMDKSESNIAEMMIIGSNMGVIDAIKNLKKYKNTESDIVNLLKRLLLFEDNNIKVLREYL